MRLKNLPRDVPLYFKDENGICFFKVIGDLTTKETPLKVWNSRWVGIKEIKKYKTDQVVDCKISYKKFPIVKENYPICNLNMKEKQLLMYFQGYNVFFDIDTGKTDNYVYDIN